MYKKQQKDNIENMTSDQVLSDQCDCGSHVGTKLCGKIKCAKDRKNTINQNSRNRKKAKLGAPEERKCSICPELIEEQRAKNRATTCGKRSCYNGRKRRNNLKKNNKSETCEYMRDPACSVLKELQTEISGRIAKTAILEEEHTILSKKLATIKDEMDNNSIELRNRQEQLQEQKKRVAIIPSIFDEMLLTVFYPGSAIIRQCNGINRSGCLYGNCISIFLGVAVVTIEGIRTVACSECSEYATDVLEQMMEYDVSPDRAFRYLVRNGNCVVGTCDVCDVADIIPSSTHWERAHDFAKSQGGSKDPYNIFCAHARCNDKQKVLHIDTYRAKLGLPPVRRSLQAKLGVSKEDIDALVNKLKQTKANAEEVVKLANTLLC